MIKRKLRRSSEHWRVIWRKALGFSLVRIYKISIFMINLENFQKILIFFNIFTDSTRRHRSIFAQTYELHKKTHHWCKNFRHRKFVQLKLREEPTEELFFWLTSLLQLRNSFGAKAESSSRFNKPAALPCKILIAAIARSSIVLTCDFHLEYRDCRKSFVF